MLYVIANHFPVTDFLLDSLDESDECRVLRHPHGPKSVARSLAKAIAAWSPVALPIVKPFPEAYLRSLRGIAAGDSLLVFGVENLRDLALIRRHARTSSAAIFLWNPVVDYKQSTWLRRRYLSRVRNLGFRISTFDPADARRFQLALVPQVYRRVDAWLRGHDGAPTHADPDAFDFDIYFIGKDKHRFADIDRLGAKWRAMGLRIKLQVMADKRKTYPTPAAVELLRSQLSYEENLESVTRSRCLLEIVQANQAGITIRCLEALFFGKKLVTNNVHIKAEPFYDSRRIFILGDDHESRLREFLTVPAPPLPAAALDPHVFTNWIRRFVQ
jgi:hypothetical protein